MASEQMNGTPNTSKEFLPIEIDFKYRVACIFLKEMKDKAYHFSFDDQQRIHALKAQAEHGPLDVSNFDPPGMFDFVGKARWLATS
ncbi:hypothetical protein Ciccas_001353 [Cichlidogyrus casuarinus]|uniref:ACB domain-containing protein n=1 Tax=Cichlidogyrus casuarinus TaxID=1844966 RepID=A0ABD2QKJ4_9PLAT